MSTDIYDDVEQGERVRRWLSENGSSIVIGLIVAFGVVFGFDKYRGFQADQRYQAAEAYAAFNSNINTSQNDAARANLDQLLEHYADNLYSDLAALRLAASLAQDGALDQAATTLRGLRERTAHTGINTIAGLRLARLFVAQGQAAQALDILNGLPQDDTLDAMMAEIRGDALVALGREDEARGAYERAVAAGEGSPQQLLQLKLDHISAGDAPSDTDQAS